MIGADKMAKVKIPKIAVLRKAILDIEESDPLYRKMSDFHGITIKKVRVDKDEDDIKDYVVYYDAKVHFIDETREHFDCWMKLETIMNFLKTPLS